MRMWFWILVTILLNRNEFVTSMLESVNNHHNDPLQPDDEIQSDDNMYLYFDEHMLKNQKSETDDIEARRRSALDKNFMRFGRADQSLSSPNYYPLTDLDENQDEDNNEQEEYLRPDRFRARNDNFLRFGRGRASDFLRFGRDANYMQPPRGKDKNIIRFGRNGPRTTKRNRRAVDDGMVKRHRNDNFLRFGRIGNFTQFSYGFLPFLKQLAARIRFGNKCDNCPRID